MKIFGSLARPIIDEELEDERRMNEIKEKIRKKLLQRFAEEQQLNNHFFHNAKADSPPDDEIKP